MADVCFIKKMGSLMPWRIKIRDILRLYQFHITNDLSVRSCRETRLKVGVLIRRRITLASIVASQNSTVRPLRYYEESHWQVLWHHRTVLYVRYDTTENHTGKYCGITEQYCTSATILRRIALASIVASQNSTVHPLRYCTSTTIYRKSLRQVIC